jgi:DNA polymerase-3 subunit alpha
MLDGAARVTQVVKQACEYNMPAAAITDHGYMYGVVDFYKQATKAGIKPVIGCEVYFVPERQLSGGKPDLYHLLLLAKNDEGYRNLMALVSDAAVSGFYYRPQVDLQTLSKYSEGLIGTSACMSGIVSKSIELGLPDEARRWARTYAQTFAPGDFYLEIQEQGIVADNGVSQKQINAQIAQIGEELSLPLVATNDVHYLTRADATTQDVLLCIGTGKTLDETNRMRFSCDEFYFKSAEEMAQALPEYPEALANTLAIAEKCDVSIETGKIILPVFEVPGEHSEESYLRELCIEGLKERYGDPIPPEALERLDYELSIVAPKGIAAYFLIVADFTKWAKDNGIGVGPGRGSAAGSIIAYVLGITNLDPLEQGLLFERFLNLERTEMPDIDMDFDDARRPEVIDYVRQKYGDDKVCQIVTFGTLKARAAIRDAGRVLGYPYSIPDKISKAIPAMPLDIKIDQALFGDREKNVSANADLRAEYEANADTKRILDHARAIEGITRNEGVHAAGVVIAPKPLHYFLPIKKDTKGGAIVTQYDGPTVAELGLLKMDFLGLRTLTVIADAVRNIARNHGVMIDLDALPFDDPATFDLLQRGDTDGVFQVESGGMKNTLRQLKPTKFSDIVAVVALFRPGPMDSIPEYIARKHGRSRIVYYDDRLKPILEDTYGMLVYQEQVMRIAMAMSGFSGAKADKLRKGMAKKIAAIMNELKPVFIGGAVENGYDRKMVEGMWSDIEKFGAYAFNKSHAAAYAVLSYQTAYLKAHYPVDYMAAVLTSYTGKTDEIVRYIAATRSGGIEVLPPDVNSSELNFAAVGGAIRFGLAGMRGVGEGVAEEIVRVREVGGPYESLHDFCERVDLTRMNKKTVESLVKGGAFDSTGYTRKHLMSMLDDAVDGAVKRQKDVDSGQGSIFDMLAAEDHGHATEVPVPNGDEWDKKMKLEFEKLVLGIYVSDHPLREIEEALRGAADHSLGELDEVADGTVAYFAGMLATVERRPTRKGTMMAIVTLEDLTGSIEAVIFPQTLERYRELVVPDAVLRFKAKFEDTDRGRKLLVEEIEPFDGEAFRKPPGRVIIDTDAGALSNGRSEALREILGRYPGRDIVLMSVVDEDSGKRVEVKLTQTVNRAATGLHAELLELFGPGRIKDSA